jgi:porphyrinogen peroxidase
MLTNMFVGNPPGTTDRILDFSTAVTGTLFFVPTSDFLDDPPAPGASAEADEGADSASNADPAPNHEGDGGGSLRIGSLRPPR